MWVSLKYVGVIAIINKLRSNFKRGNFKWIKRSYWETCYSIWKTNTVKTSTWISTNIESNTIKRNRKSSYIDSKPR